MAESWPSGLLLARFLVLPSRFLLSAGGGSRRKVRFLAVGKRVWRKVVIPVLSGLSAVSPLFNNQECQ